MSNVGPGSPVARVVAELSRGVLKFVTRDHVAKLLAVSLRQVDAVLQPGVDAGLLMPGHDGDHGKVWLLGLAQRMGQAGRRKGGARAKLPLLDVGSLQVRHGVPLPQRVQHKNKSTIYGAVFELLLVDEASVGGLPLEYKHALKSAAARYLKLHPELAKVSRFVVAVEDSGKTVGVWREALSQAAPKAAAKAKP